MAKQGLEEEGDSAGRRFTVVMSSSSAVRTEPDTRIRLAGLPVATGVAEATWFTRHSPEGFETAVPEMWVEISGVAPTIDEALEVLGEAGRIWTPVLSLVTNAPIDDPEVVLAFDSTPGVTDREYFQIFRPVETGMPRPTRLAPVEWFAAAVGSVLAHSDSVRIHRAIVHHHEALKLWRPGHDLALVNHLWIAVEALTKAILRTECARLGFEPDALAAHWQVDKKQLDGEVRRRLVFHGNSATYREANEVSNGLEHAFITLPELHARALAVRGVLAGHVRMAILEVLDLGSDAIDALGEPPYRTVKESYPFSRHWRGRLAGKGENLAADDQPYPWVDWSSTIVAFSQNDDGSFALTPREDVTFRLGPGISMSGMSFELWGPRAGSTHAAEEPLGGAPDEGKDP